jgi:hypothetical protein
VRGTVLNIWSCIAALLAYSYSFLGLINLAIFFNFLRNQARLQRQEESSHHLNSRMICLNGNIFVEITRILL